MGPNEKHFIGINFFILFDQSCGQENDGRHLWDADQ